MKAEEFKKETREHIYQHITKIKSAQGVFDLFRLLDYPKDIVFDISSKRRKTSFDFKKEDEQRIKEIYSILSFDEKLPVFLLEATTLAPSFIRSVTNTFDKQYLQFILIFTTGYSEIVFVFPDREKVEAGKHKLRLTKLIVDIEDIISKKEYYSVIETLANIRYENEASWRDVWKKWKKAFSVERVTKDFFKDYKNIFFTLRNDLHKQNVPRKESHEFTLQFLNRIMFIYFISKKKWLEQPKFIEWLWSSYKNLGKFGSNEFYEKWLKQVFLKAFNNRSDEIKSLPDDIVKVILSAPYLNGGLFRQNNLDSLKIEINDRMFQRIFEFFEKYNFTIKEDMPLESEVAVDPQMIGYVYESLAYVGDEIYDRNDLGIFYTPRVEVDFMCRRSLAEYLSKNLPEIPKEKFYHLIFDLPEEKEKIEKWFAKGSLWRKLEETLDNLSVVDPACGSGAFLVGMLNVVAEVYRMIYKHMDRNLTDFQLKNRITQCSLYGVDVMPWAIHAAELRLWLQLIVETEFKKDELRKHPLLPNLNLNLRIGDSLVQEIGGISFNLRTNNLKPHLKNKLENLKQEKRKYFENSPNARFKTPEEVKAEEIRLFEEIIDERVESLGTDIEVLKNDIKQRGKQTSLFGEAKGDVEILAKDKQKREEKEREIQKCQEEIEKLNKIKVLLRDPEKKPFVWDIDFAEIFSEKNGFDIVIGNPPYVTRTSISPPNRLKKEVTKLDRDEYKLKLIESLKTLYPFIGKTGTMLDLYVYFYFHGMGLLNEKGTFCFITSNSWLSVGFGEILRDFLARYGNIIGIFDSRKRSFEHAKINTVITILGKPDIQSFFGDYNFKKNKRIAKFILFKQGFEFANTNNNILIENSDKNIVNTDLALYVIEQNKLIKNGGNNLSKMERVISQDWSLFKAPEIFFRVVENEKVLELSKVAKVKVGFRTGANDFYYLDKKMCKELKIEQRFLKPIITTPKECSNILININKLPNYVFICNKPKTELKNTYALKYIESSEKKEIEVKKGPERGKKVKGYQNLELIRLAGRRNWYSLGEPEIPYIVLPLVYYKRPIICINEEAYNDVNLVGVHPLSAYRNEGLALSLLSTINFMNWELFGIANLGEGSIKLNPSYVEKSRILNPSILSKHSGLIKKFSKRQFGDIFLELGINPDKPIREQEPKPLPDRAELDKIVFDELGLTKEERKEVYWSVCELVKQRLEKARSLRD